MSFKRIGQKEFTVGESPRWDIRERKLWFTDVPEQKLNIYDPETDRFDSVSYGRNISGFAFNEDGRLILATHTGLFIGDRSGNTELIAEEIDHEYLKCNDCSATPDQGFIFGTSFYDPGLNHGDLGSLYYMNRERQITKLEEGIVHSNGMGFSADGKLFYYTDCAARTIYRYEYHEGTLKNKTVFVKVPRYEGLPDGLAVDSEGYVWSAQWYGGAVIRYNPEGEKDFIMRTPAQQTSALAFGGKNLEDIYVTTAGRWAYLEDAPIRYEYDANAPGGGLFCYNYGIKGNMPLYAAIK